jgi:hypothetical protein
MVIEYQLTRPAYVKIILLMVIRNWSFYVFPALLIAAIVVGAILHTYVYAIIMAAAFIFIYGISIINAVFSQKNRNFFRPVKYTFGDGDIRVESAITKNTMNWSTFVKWRQLGDYYLIYPSNNNFLCIPRSAIPEGNVTGFEALLTSKIKHAVSP